MKVDYIIVGCGLAGISFAETALNNGKSIYVFDNNTQTSSTIAGGLYNPVVLKRFSEVWHAKEQLDLLTSLYSNLEHKLKVKLDFKIPILRKFFSIEEQNNWFVASDKVTLSSFLSPKLIKTSFKGIDAPYHYGEVLQTGYIDTALLLKEYKKKLITSNSFSSSSFEYDKIIFFDDYLEYYEIQAKHILFAEGFGMHLNPFFNFLPLDGTKGELVIIKAPNLQLDVIINTSIFILPLGTDTFKVGATYNWKDKTNIPTKEGLEELLLSIKEIIKCDFEVIKHFAGVRPTVRDRKPLIGTHPQYNKIHILNGLGTRGVMLAPEMAKFLFESIEFGSPFPKEIAISRYSKLMK